MKKFSGVNGPVTDESVSNDYATAAAFEKIRVGNTGVFIPQGLAIKYFPFDYIDNAFERINEVNGRLCCGNASFYYYRLVLAHDGKEFIDYLTENEDAVTGALKAIAEADSTIRIGFTKE